MWSTGLDDVRLGGLIADDPEWEGLSRTLLPSVCPDLGSVYLSAAGLCEATGPSPERWRTSLSEGPLHITAALLVWKFMSWLVF